MRMYPRDSNYKLSYSFIDLKKEDGEKIASNEGWFKDLHLDR